MPSRASGRLQLAVELFEIGIGLLVFLFQIGQLGAQLGQVLLIGVECPLQPSDPLRIGRSGVTSRFRYMGRRDHALRFRQFIGIDSQQRRVDLLRWQRRCSQQRVAEGNAQHEECRNGDWTIDERHETHRKKGYRGARTAFQSRGRQ